MADFSFNNAYDILTARREKALSDASDRKSALIENDPEFAGIESSLAEAGHASVLAAVKRDKETADSAKKNVQALALREKEYLLRKGYGEDYLDPVYFCKKCNDTGMTGPFGSKVKCSCYRQLILDDLRKESGLSCTDASFDKFDLTFYPEENEEGSKLRCTPRKNAENILNTCRDFTDNFSSASDDLLFTGNTGLGKTYLCSCIASEMIKKDVQVMYITAFRLFKTICAFNPTEEEQENSRVTEEYLRNTPLLIIDDLGAENTSEARKSALLDILNTRESNNAFFPCKTVISTNMTPVQLKDYYGERFVSRLIGRFNICAFEGPDIRIQKKLRSK